ncbi:hypothetical protein IPL85_01135 [Candidatus Saccharibacteria bacterium]|nr:MAG: hypothetical protein IPL85_01135 [Candidatus Saccharibacteria bacterium]
MFGIQKRAVKGAVFLAVCLLFGMAFFLSSPHTDAAINQQINFQGKLTNPDGTNVTNGAYSIVFSIYTVSSGGSAVWTETQPSVSVADGIFQVSLGSVTSLPGSVDFNTNSLYLGVKVGADAEMTPRIQFTASPYAFNADQVDGLTSAQFVQLAQGVQSDTSTTSASIGVNKTGATASVMDLQRNGATVFSVGNNGAVLMKNQADSATAFQIQSTGSVAILSADTSGSEVVIGSNATDTTQVLLQLDSFSTFADTATCGTTTNQGGLYYNTSTNVIRGCVNGTWEDMVSTAGLGLQLFGVLPDSGANPGDIYGVTAAINGPCKVAVGANTTTVSWTGCTAYSGGRKVIVTAGTATTTNAVAARFQHLCLTGANNQPALSASGTETANLATVSFPSATSPILCLADIGFTGANNTITQIYDTRTYTTTEKATVALNSAIGIGTIVTFVATKGVVQSTTTANFNNIGGVIVATTGAASTTTINAIMATGGPAAVKAITGSNTVNSYLFTSATAGYARTVATKPTEGTGTIYNVLGNARTVWSGATACAANADNCAGSIVTFIDKR